MKTCLKDCGINNPPDERVRVIRASLRAFIFGLIGLIPLLGFLPGCYAVILWFRLPKDVWNPALRYSSAGALMGTWAILSTAIFVWAVAISISMS